MKKLCNVLNGSASKLALATLFAAILLSFAEYRHLSFTDTATELLHIRGVPQATFYCIAYLASVTGLVILVNLRSRVLSFVTFALLFVLFGINYFMLRAFSEPITQDHINAAITGILSARDFFSAYRSDIALSAASAATLVLALAWPVRRYLHAFGWLASSLIPLAGGVLACSAVWWTRDALTGFPSPYRTITNVALFASQPRLFEGARAALPSDLQVGRAPDADVIILLVDESISSDALGINGAERNTTPYLASIAPSYVNLGRAISGGNHSVSSNMILQGLLRADQLPDRSQRSLRGPNIFRFAKHAGYHTAYVDAQSAPFGYINYMRPADSDTIDVWYRVNDHAARLPLYERDRHTIGVVRDLIAQHKRLFVYVVKQGAHAPYEGYYPEIERIFTPVMSSPSFAASSVKEIQGSYANAVRWSVDSFLQSFLSALDLQRTAVIYTSDHGQSIADGGRGVGTHGKVHSPPPSQAEVPMLAFGTTAETRLRPVVATVREKTSHFHIAPSLLVMMGYPEQWVVRSYGPPLWLAGSGSRVFLSGDLYGRGRAYLNRFE